jgi:hypothetical protein
MALLNTACPRCGATNAKLLSVIYEEGLSTSEGEYQSEGRTNTIARVKVTTKGTSSGVSQTAASKAAAPPSLPNLSGYGSDAMAKIILSGLGIALVSSLVTLGVTDSGGKAILIFLFFAVGSFLLSTAFNSKPKSGDLKAYWKAHPEEYKKHLDWPKTFSCGSCANRFIP